MAIGSSAPRLPVLRGAIVGLVVSALLAALGALGVFTLLDLRIFDLRYDQRGPQQASPRVALVEVDDATIAGYQTWPLSRETYALLAVTLEDAGADAIGFDMMLMGENTEASDGDRLLAAVSSQSERVVHAIAFMPEDPRLSEGAAPTERRDLLIRHGRPIAGQRLASAQGIALPYPDLFASARALGHTAVAVDPDGVVRRVPLFVRYGDWAYPSLAVALVEVAARRDSALPQFELDQDGIRLHWRGHRRRVPADSEGATSIVFAGNRASFPQSYSMLRVLQWRRDGDTLALARAFNGKLVLVGVTAEGSIATDLGATPVSSTAPLVYIHANAVNAALNGRFLARPPIGLGVGALLLLGALLGALFAALPLPISVAVAIVALLAIGAADYALFLWRDIDVPSTSALLLSPVSWIAVEGYRRIVTERRARASQRELEIARAIQRRMLPAGPPDLAEAQIFGVNLPAEAVGGDYYDWLPLGDDSFAVVVGDVAGHGVPAALLMSHLRASFHAEARVDRSPREIVEAMHRELTRATEPNRYATFFLVVFSRRESTLRFCNAGHNPPLLVHDGALDPLPATGIPLAMLEDMTWGEDVRAFDRGDVLVLFSDGVVEYWHRQEMYGDERWQQKVLEVTRAGGDAETIGRALLVDVQAFARGQPAKDDVTIVVIRRT